MSWSSQGAGQTDADTVAVGVFAGADAPAGVPPEVAELFASGEARRSLKSLALAHSDRKRWLVVGLGEREDFTPERARVAAAVARERSRELSTKVLCWQTPTGDGEVAAALVHGTVLADYSFDSHKSHAEDASGEDTDKQPKHLEGLILTGEGDLATVIEQARIVAEAVNEARDLQNRPANDLTPSALAEHARRLGEQIEHLSVETEGRAGIVGRSMGAFAAVARGSEQEPALITLRYEPPNLTGPAHPVLGLVGKAVTFDSGGISLKPGPKMSEMKFDMSGGAAVISAIAAIARIGLPVRIVGVVGATENLPSGRSVKPGDIVTASNGKTIEINNTDAEGRLVLADCLCHAIASGAERVVDLATLTGAVIVALGSTYAGLLSNDEALAGQVAEAGARSGEIVWRLPLHPEYDELVKGRYGDLDNAPEGRKAGTIVGAAFLSHFVGETPWAHLDIAGSAWELGRAYVGKGASGYGVRLLVELARAHAASA
ncbi:MAG TPA: leucyl aminopeptidase [Solirubrobacteraceae bacterium]|nr:leucyl aminopeptidase [Solirubrobacteraceae bacterium]